MIHLFICTPLFCKDALMSMTGAFEKQVQHAAGDWLEGRHARALDGFLASRDIVRKHMPSLKEDFDWQTASVLMSYSMLLARLVEIDLHVSRGESHMTDALTVQSREWAERLRAEAAAWTDISVRSLDKMELRNRWLARITRAIQNTKNVKG